jgi:proteasome lid subunit RPN8/RPN11
MTQVSVVEVIPVENELHSPVRFRMAAQEQLKAFLRFEERGLELVGLFHSHPAGPVHPSPTDLAEFAYPGVLTVILAPGERARPAGAAAFLPRAYAIDGVLSAAAHFTEVPITLLPAG